jgi:hypothetical protein
MKKLALAAAAALSASGVQADVTYDAFTSFNATNGAGNFFWASGTPTGATTLDTVACVINNTTCLGLPGAVDGLPGVFKSTGVASTSHPYQPLDRLLVHPGSASSLLAMFAAPVAGSYSFTATLDALTAGTSVAIFASTNASGAPVTIGTSFLGTLGQSHSFSGTYDLDAGETILIGVNNAGNYASDSTGLVFTVTQHSAAVPEPAAWAMMIGGFGLAGAALRRRPAPAAVRA